MPVRSGSPRWVWGAALLLVLVGHASRAAGLPPDRAPWVAFGVLIGGLSLAGVVRARGGTAVGLLIAAACVYLGLVTDWRFTRRHHRWDVPGASTSARP